MLILWCSMKLTEALLFNTPLLKIAIKDIDILFFCIIFVKFAHGTPNFIQKRLRAMDNPHYNRIKAVLAEKDKTGTWLSEQMGRNIGTVSRWMTNKVQPSVEQLYDIAKHLDVDVRELLVASK